MRICVQWSVEEYSSSKSCTRWHLYVSSASWNKAGYRSSFTIGSFWNPSFLGRSLTSLMQRVLLKIRTRTSILRTSQFLNCHCRSIDPDLIAPAALISLMSLVSLTCLNFLSSPSHMRWSSVDISLQSYRDKVDRSRSCNVYPRFVTVIFSRIPSCVAYSALWIAWFTLLMYKISSDASLHAALPSANNPEQPPVWNSP